MDKKEKKEKKRHELSNLFDIFTTVVNGNEHGLKIYLTKGGNVNLEGRNATTLLHKATEDGNISKVKMLLKHGCSVDSQDKDGCTPVYVAVNKGHHSILKVLLEAGACVNTLANQLEAGACVNTVANPHSTPLILAVIRNDCESVRLLLECSKNCDIDMENDLCQTALTQAIDSNNLTLCKILLSHGAVVKCIYNKSVTEELARIMCQNTAWMKTFLEYSKRMDLNYHLRMACKDKNLHIAEMILLKFENPFHSNALGFVTKQEEDEVWEPLTKVVVKPYKLATKCSKDNEYIMMLLNFCISENRNHKARAKIMIRILVKYGLVIHPQTSIKPCKSDCECRALYENDPVATLKGQCCSVIRQTLHGESYFDPLDVEKLPIPGDLQRFICMADW